MNEDGTNPPNESMSPDEDNCGSRPNYSYRELITMAIGSSTEGKLTSNAIQNWISENFPYYSKEEQGWQNRIKQTLSTSSCFYKIKRPVNDPGRGYYWAISPEEGALQAEQPVVGNEVVIGAIVNGIKYPQTPNAVYFLTGQEIHALQEQEELQEHRLKQDQLAELTLRQQQIQQEYEEVYQQIAFHQQQIALLMDQQISE